MTRFLLLAILLLTPLPLGSNRPLFEAVLAIASASALISWGWHGKIALEWRRLSPILCCFSAIWGWGLLGPSVDKTTSLTSLMQLSTYFALFILALQLGRDSQFARQAIKLLAYSCGFYAFYGLCVYALGNDHILWLEKWAYADSLTGTFVNRNAFAAYAGMGLLASLALVAQEVIREDGNLRALWRNAAASFWATLFGSGILCLAIILTNSRAGIVSIGLGLIALWAGLWFSRSLPKRTLLILALFTTLIAASSVLVVGERLIQRTENAVFLKDDRPQIWLATLRIIKAAPLTGHGLGTYEQMFLQYRTPAIKQNYTKAHSTYLEIAATIGLPATALFFSGFALIGVFLLRGIHIRRQNKIYPVLGFAIFTQAAAHALVDFSFQTPANAAILAIMLGVGVAQSFSAEQA